MHVTKAKVLGTLAAVAIGAVLLGSRPAHSQDNHCQRIHQEIEKARIPLRSVVLDKDGTYTLVFRSGCSPAQAKEATAIKDRVLRECQQQAKPTRVTTTEEALVVLQFEPDNAKARALLERRYKAIKKKNGSAK